jgi:putative membrane protein
MTPVTTEEAAAIERYIAGIEARTGVQVVAAVMPRSDSYPELPWRAFALGAALAALIGLAIDVGRPDWLSARGLLIQTLFVLAGGAIAGLAAARIDAFAKLFLGTARAKTEVRQCAEVLFLTREMFKTPRRDAVLLLVSQFERRVVVVPDVYHRGRATHDDWEGVIAQMTPKLREGRTAEAFTAGLAAIEAVLVAKGIAIPAGERENLFPDALLRGETP